MSNALEFIVKRSPNLSVNKILFMSYKILFHASEIVNIKTLCPTRLLCKKIFKISYINIGKINNHVQLLQMTNK